VCFAEEERLLLNSKISPETNSVTPNTWTASWSILESINSMSTVVLKCVSVGDPCDAVADAPITEVGKLKKSGTVEGLYPLNSYDCYAITKGKLLKKPVCSDPVRVDTPQRTQVYSQDFFYPANTARAPPSPAAPVWASDVTICQFNSNGTITTCGPSGFEGYNTSYGVIRNDQRYGWWVTYDTFSQSPQLVTSCALEPTGMITPGSCNTVYNRNDSSAQVWSIAFNADQTQVAILSQMRGVGQGDVYLTFCDVNSDASFVCDAALMVMNGTNSLGENDLYYMYVDPSENYLFITGQNILGKATGVMCGLLSQTCGPMTANVSAATRTGLFNPDVPYPEINALSWTDSGALVSYRTSTGNYLIDSCSFELSTGAFVNCSSFQANPSVSYLPNGRPWYTFAANSGNDVLVYGATGRASLHLYLYTCPVVSGLMGTCQLSSDNPNVTGISFPTFNGMIVID
jgi:hypothetical protein